VVFLISLILIVTTVAVLLLLLRRAEKKATIKKRTPAQVAQDQAKEQFEAVVAQQTEQLQKTLQARAEKIDQAFARSLEQITARQLQTFAKLSDDFTKKTAAELQAVSMANTTAGAQAKTEISALTAQAKAEAIKKIDTQIAELMASYLAEIAPNLDYQDQKAFLFDTLEAHKDELKKDIENGL